MEEPRHLPAGYCLLNLETVLTEVCARYGDFLQEEEARVLAAFLALPLGARRLYARLLTRKGPWFREDGLDYREVEDVPGSLRSLVAAGFCDEAARLDDLLSLLVKEELVACLQRRSIPCARALRRGTLAERLLASADAAALEAELRASLRPVRPLHLGLWSLLCFLFFGSAEQDLSSFVLADLGKVRYERYALDPAHRLFESRRDVDFLLSLRDLREAASLAAARQDAGSLETITRDVLAMEPHSGVRQQRRYQRLLNELGRIWERLRELELARTCYARSGLPPSRERQARLLADPAQACGLAMAMAEAPLDVSEERFAQVFLTRHGRRVPDAARWLREHPAPEPLPERHLTLPRQASVEQAVLDHAGTEGWAGFFTENHLWNALFGLACWEELFAPVPGAFQHRFQAAPMDIGHPDFFARRREAFEHRLAEFQDGAVLARRILATAEAKRGVANAFVAWRQLAPGLLEAVVDRVPAPVLVPVLRTLAQSPRAFASGFPDLFLFHPDGSDWALWEVKGPGDSLRPEQERWLGQFQRLGCDVQVVRVKWRA